MKTKHFSLTIFLFLVLSVCMPPAAMAAVGDSDVRPGATNPVTTSRQTLFRDDEVLLFSAIPSDHNMGYMYAVPENNDLTSWQHYNSGHIYPSSDFGPFKDNDIRPIASASGRNANPDRDYATYAFFQPDGSVAVEQWAHEVGRWYTNTFSGSNYPMRSLDIALGDLDGLTDAEGRYYDEIVLVRTTDDGDVKVNVIGHDEDLTSLDEDIFPYDWQALQIAVDIGDLNGDGTLEFVVGLREFEQYQIVVYNYCSNEGVPELVRASTYKRNPSDESAEGFDLTVGDFDGDGKEEVFVAVGEAGNQIDLLQADEDLNLSLVDNIINAQNGVGYTLRVVSGLFKFDPANGWGLNRRQVALCYQPLSDTILCYNYEADTNLQLSPVAYQEWSVTGSDWGDSCTPNSYEDCPTYRISSLDITTGNFVGHGVDKKETSPLMDLAVSYVETREGGSLPDKMRPAMRILSNHDHAGMLIDKWYWSGGEQDYDYDQGAWQMATTVSAADGDGDTYRLGAPAHIVMDNVLRLDRIIQEPPKHVDYLPNDYDDLTKGWSVINVSGYSDFAVSLHVESNHTLATETTSTSSWNIGGGEELDVKATVTLGDMDIAGVSASAESDTKLGYDYEENKSSYNSDYQSLTYTQETATETDDIVQGLLHTIDVWRYPILGYYDLEADVPYGYQEIVMPSPATYFDKAAGRDHPDWYQPWHENHNLLSYAPFVDMLSTDWQPDDLGSFNIGGDDMSVVMNDDIVMHWDGNRFSYGVLWSDEAGAGSEKDYNNTLSESEEITVGVKGKATLGWTTVETTFTGKISFHNSNSWGGSTVSKATNSNTTGIHIGYTLQDNPSGATYAFKPAAYITNSGGAFKVAYAVGPPQADWWRGQYGRKPDPALNLPIRLKWHEADQEHGNTEYWYLNRSSDKHNMRGFLMRQLNYDLDTEGYPLLSSIIVDGDTVRLCARVYNYSLGKNTGNFLVRFYYYPWDIEEAKQIAVPVSQSGMVATANLESLDTYDGTSREEICVLWDTTGLSTEYTYNDNIVNTFRFKVVLDEDEQVDEIHELYDDAGDEVLGTNNIGTFPWVNAVAVSANPGQSQTDVDFDQIDLKIAAGSMAVKTEQGIVRTNDKGGPLHLELGKTYEIRALVQADQDHPFHRLLFLYDGDPDGKGKGKRKGHPAGKGKGNPNGKGKVIGSSRVHGLETGSTYVWMRWTPDTLGKQEIWMRLFEDSDEVNPGNAIDSLEVIVVPAKKSHPKKSK